jgi:SAM-dependent methyltransferase
MSHKPIALDAYEALADAYAAAVETKPHNAYYERPATLSLLPEVAGKRVLDAGCGPGIYAEWLVERGAEVFAVDASPRMIELARRRLGDSAEVREANLAEPLSFLDSSSFDIVLSPLALDYVEDWSSAFSEFHRVLRPAGHFVFSIHHPSFDLSYYKTDHYFETEVVVCEWRGFDQVRVLMPSYRRPLSATLNTLVEAGFRIERILEPQPTEEFREADPKHYQELSRQPCFLCIRAQK